MLKRTVCILMLLTFISQGCLAQNVFSGNMEAENHTPLSGVLFKEGEVIELEEAPVNFFSTNTLTFDEYIAEAVLSEEELPAVITGLEKYEISQKDFLYNYVQATLKHPETFLFSGYNQIGVVQGTDIVGAVAPIYVVSSMAEAESAKKAMEEAIKEYTDLADKYDTDLEKLLVIHDKMVADCDYEVKVLSKDESVVESVDKTVYHALGALKNKFAVCQGYSQALYMIAKELGIEFDFCYCAEKNHMWNYVKLEDKWYHMDMTNDDPLENGAAREDSRAWHGYFMVSDEGLSASAHGTTFSTLTGKKYTCDDTRYESNHLFNMNGAVFTAEKDAGGYYTVVLENVEGPLGTEISVPFKSKTLYTGPVIPYPFITEAPIAVTESGEAVISPCLFLAQYATTNLPTVTPFVKTAEWIKAYPSHDAFKKDSYYMIGIAADVENNPVENFSSFLFDTETLCPWSIAKTWTLQQN